MNSELDLQNRIAEKLHPGDVVKNYKELCKMLGIPVKTGESKVYQILDLERYISFEKEKTAFIIKEVFNTPFPKVDKRFTDIAAIEQFKINSNDARKSGIYIIHNETHCYVGSTRNFYARFSQHISIHNPMRYTKELLDNNGVFEALYINEDNLSRNALFELEQKYIDQYKSSDKYILLNRSDVSYENHKGHHYYKTDSANRKPMNIKGSYRTIRVPKEYYDEIFNMTQKYLEGKNVDGRTAN